MIALITKVLDCGFQPIGNPDYPTLRKQAAVAVQLGFRFNPVTLWPEVCFDITENPTHEMPEVPRDCP